MRGLALALAIPAALALTSCSHPRPPAGRWEGTYESADVMIAARVEIEPDGRVRLSAPDLVGVSPSSDEERAAMHARLADKLAQDWSGVAPREMDFDGTTFRYPDGVAPRMILDSATRQIALFVYLGRGAPLHIRVHAVGNFSDDPWQS